MADTAVLTETSAPTIPSPAVSASGRPQAHGAPAVKRQIVAFSFYKIMPEWRRLPAEERAAHKAAFVDVIMRWNRPTPPLARAAMSISAFGLSATRSKR